MPDIVGGSKNKSYCEGTKNPSGYLSSAFQCFCCATNKRASVKSSILLRQNEDLCVKMMHEIHCFEAPRNERISPDTKRNPIRAALKNIAKRASLAELCGPSGPICGCLWVGVQSCLIADLQARPSSFATYCCITPSTLTSTLGQ